MGVNNEKYWHMGIELIESGLWKNRALMKREYARIVFGVNMGDNIMWVKQ